MRARPFLGLMLLVSTIAACGGSQAVSDVQRVWCSAHPDAVVVASEGMLGPPSLEGGTTSAGCLSQRASSAQPHDVAFSRIPPLGLAATGP